MIDLLDSSDFQDYSRFDLSVRKTCYERDNRTPTLIADRAPWPIVRTFWSLLDEYAGWTIGDPLEWPSAPPALYRRQAVLPRSAEGAPGAPGDEGSICVYGELAPGRWLVLLPTMRRRCRGMRAGPWAATPERKVLYEASCCCMRGRRPGEAGRDEEAEGLQLA